VKVLLVTASAGLRGWNGQRSSSVSGPDLAKRHVVRGLLVSYASVRPIQLMTKMQCRCQIVPAIAMMCAAAAHHVYFQVECAWFGDLARLVFTQVRSHINFVAVYMCAFDRAEQKNEARRTLEIAHETSTVFSQACAPVRAVIFVIQA
jgi:hypothetical protein